MRIFRNIKKYLTIFKIMFSRSVQQMMAYRVNFISALVSAAGWTNFTLVMILILNSQTGGFGDWSADEMLLLNSVWMMNNGICFAMFYGNIKDLINEIPLGKIDSLLTRPIDSQFSVSLRRTLITSFISLAEGIALLTISISRMSITPSIEEVLLFIYLCFIAIVIYYSIWFFAATLNIHFYVADNFFRVVPEIIEVSKFPPSSYPKPAEMLFSSLIPIIIMTAFPAQTILGEMTTTKILYATGLGFVFFFGSRFFWKWSLKRYTSGGN